MDDLDEDKQCMLRLQGGDDLALNDLMARWQKPLVSFILRYAGNILKEALHRWKI